MTDSSKIKVTLQLDEEEAARLLTGINKTTAALNGLEESGKPSAEATKLHQEYLNAIKNTGKAAQDVAKQEVKNQQNVSVAIKGSIEQYEFEDQKLNELLQTARALGKDEQFYAILSKKGYSEGIVAIQQMLGMKRQDNALTKEQIQLINARATELRHESIAIRRGAADLHLFSQAALVTGTATLGGILLMARQYADSMKEGNAVALEFLAAQNRMTTARNRIGQVFARESLPFLREVTGLLDKAGQFLEAHPEIVPAAIKGAEILVGVGILGKGISTAARLTADFLAIHSSILRLIAARAVEAQAADKQVGAAELMNVAADKQIAAAEGQGAAATGGSAKAGLAGLGGLGGAAAIAALVAANVIAAKKLSDNLDKMRDFLNTQKRGVGDIARAGVAQIFTVLPGGQFLQIVDTIKKISNFVQGIERRFSKQSEENHRTLTTPGRRQNIAESVPGSVINSKNLEAMLEAYEDFTHDNLALAQEHYAELLDIARKEQERIRKENEDYVRDLAKIQQTLTSRLGKLNRDYEEGRLEDERKYQERRAKLLREDALELQRIEEELQEKLRKQLIEHNFKRDELLRARDALGLVLEDRRFNMEQEEARRDADLERARRRQDQAERLRELEIEYAEQKAKRLQDYQERVAEAQQQAAEQRAERIRQHEETLREIREEAAEKIREENARFIEERRQRYNQFIAKLRDLDAYYLGEQKLTRQRHSEMIVELDAFLTLYRNKLRTIGATGTIGTKAFGGYASYGLYALGDRPSGGRGPDEFVMNGNTTRAAESIIGSKLSQQAILGAMLGSKRPSKQIIWNDQRVFDHRLSAEDRRLLNNDTRQIISEMLE